LSRIVAIHQPNFFPWLGYFDKIARSDFFILLDDVQFPKTNGTWLNRVQFLIAGEAKWVTAPVKRDYHGTLSINEMFFDEKVPWREKFLRTLEGNYKKSNFYKENIGFITELIINRQSNIGAYNIHCILSLSNYLSLDTCKIKKASDLQIATTSTQRIVDLVKEVKGDTYYCGGGATGYQEDELYSKHQIELVYQNYQSPVYTQKGCSDFVKGLSVIDALFQTGKEATIELLRK
jgi:hypothetical protein